MTITRRSFLTYAGATAGSVAAGASATPRPNARAAGWQRLGVHPGAAEQPTVIGRTIHDLEVYRGMLFAGYGDWGANSGPVRINPFDLARQRFVGARHDAYTHCINTWRLTSAGLMAPNIDPLGDKSEALDARGGFSWSGNGTDWRQQPLGPSFHVFDIADSDAGRFAVGSGRPAGETGPVVWWRRGPGDWQPSFWGDGVRGEAQDRYHWIATVDGTPHIQSSLPGGGFGPMRRFWGGGWQELPLVTERFHLGAIGSRVQVSDGRILSAGPTGLRTFTSSTRRIRTLAMPNGEAIVDLHVRGRRVTALTRSQLFRSTNAGESFTRVFAPVNGASSVAEHDGIVYLGTSSGALHARPI